MASRPARYPKRLPAVWLPAVLSCALLLGAGCRDQSRSRAVELPPVLVERNFADGSVFARDWQDSVLAVDRESARTTGERIAAWACRYRDAGRSRYLFGLAEGGYAAEGRLALDARHDCISLMYRCTELARARDAADALAVALATRFAGADPGSVVDDEGRVDYDLPEHLDFSLDMICSGRWGVDASASLPGAVADTAGSSRYRAGSFRYLPTAALADGETAADGLRDGDIAWLVLDPQHERGRLLRDEYGLVIGHVGIVVRRGGEAWLVHAGGSALPGYYEEGGVVQAPLAVYLERVPKFCGAVITRFE